MRLWYTSLEKIKVSGLKIFTQPPIFFYKLGSYYKIFYINAKKKIKNKADSGAVFKEIIA